MGSRPRLFAPRPRSTTGRGRLFPARSPLFWLGALATVAVPGLARAHSTDSGFILLLPTGYYIAGGAISVAASFALLAFSPASMFRPDADRTRGGLSIPWPRTLAMGVSVASFAFLVFLVVCGIVGSRDPLSNPLPLFVWTVWWVGLTLVQACVGNLWGLINPWSGVLAILRRATGRGVGTRALVALPARLGYLPAILIFSGFAWFELIDLAPNDPLRLAVAVSLYWVFALAAMIVFGEEVWKKRGEPFTIFFGLIGGLSPLTYKRIEPDDGRRGRVAIGLTWPGRTLIEREPMPVTGALFVLLALASVSFDGFSRTFTWLDFIGINPLEFPGRSAVVVDNTLGLLAAFVLLAGALILTVAGGCRFAGRPEATREAIGHLVFSLVPISLAFHAAHYLTSLLVGGQYAIKVMNDPFGLGWDLLGFGHIHVTLSFLNNFSDVTTIWNTQTAIICGGHIAGIVMAHVIALRRLGKVRVAVSSQYGLATLMVFYTGFGLWLLSSPTGA